MAELRPRLPVLAGGGPDRPGTIPPATNRRLGIQNGVRAGESQGHDSRL